MNNKLILLNIAMILVLIGIISAQSGETDVDFSLATLQHSCYVEGDTSYWLWWEPDPAPDGTVFTNFIPPASCYYEGGYPSWGCCPDDIQCNPPSAVDFPDQCYNSAPDVCADYNEENYGSIELAEDYCNAFNINVAIRSVEKFTDTLGICSGDYSVPIIIPDQQNCNQYTSNCRCEWDESANECKSASTSYIFCDNEYISEGNCSQDTVQKIDECIEKGLITYIWTAIWTDPLGGATRPSFCTNGTKSFACNMVKLDFFSFMNVLLVVLIVGVIYYFIYKHHKKIIKEK